MVRLCIEIFLICVFSYDSYRASLLVTITGGMKSRRKHEKEHKILSFKACGGSLSIIIKNHSPVSCFLSPLIFDIQSPYSNETDRMNTPFELNSVNLYSLSTFTFICCFSMDYLSTLGIYNFYCPICIGTCE